MKKVLAVMMALVLAFALCVPSFAEGESIPGIDEIINTITGAVGEMNVDEIITSIQDMIGGIDGGDIGGGDIDVDIPQTVTPDAAQQIVDAMLQGGATKDDVRAAVEQMHDEGTIDDESYQNLLDAIEAAEEPEGSTISGDATEIINALRQMGITDDQMKSVVDQLYERGAISQEVYDEIIRQLDAAETTTEATNEGGIGGFLSGIVDAITGLFGGGDEDGDGAGAGGETSTGTTTNPDEYAGKEPTGDTALLSVAAVAAVAGVALVLTKKKQK
ncbi:MAG: hypothetical protein ACI4K9_08060 [Candidatus Fimenecus sp.]